MEKIIERFENIARTSQGDSCNINIGELKSLLKFLKELILKNKRTSKDLKQIKQDKKNLKKSGEILDDTFRLSREKTEKFLRMINVLVTNKNYSISHLEHLFYELSHLKEDLYPSKDDNPVYPII